MAHRRIIQLNTELHKVTGIQRVMVDIHEALRDSFDAHIAGPGTFESVNPGIGLKREDYLQVRRPWQLRNSTVIIHERRLLPVMKVLSLIPGLGIKYLYVHHNEMHDHKLLSLFPKKVVAISDKGIGNLTGYFGLNPKRIFKIHNCVRQRPELDPVPHTLNPELVTVLVPARINRTKRQMEIVRQLKGRLDKRVRILFAGDGPDLEQFRELTRGDQQFVCLGYRADIPELLRQADYMMLFSEHEGLPISIIEACQSGTPVIANRVGGIPEIITDGREGMLRDTWDELADLLNSLPSVSQTDYDRMAQAARQTYEQKFMFARFKEQYTNLLDSL